MNPIPSLHNVVTVDFRHASNRKALSAKLNEYNRRVELLRGLCLELKADFSGLHSIHIHARDSVLIAERACAVAMIDESLIADIEKGTEGSRHA
jgi:hypothetical protein